MVLLVPGVGSSRKATFLFDLQSRMALLCFKGLKEAGRKLEHIYESTLATPDVCEPFLAKES